MLIRAYRLPGMNMSKWGWVSQPEPQERNQASGVRSLGQTEAESVAGSGTVLGSWWEKGSSQRELEAGLQLRGQGRPVLWFPVRSREGLLERSK